MYSGWYWRSKSRLGQPFINNIVLNCSTYSGRRRVGQFVTKNSAIEYCGVEVKSTNTGPDTILLSPYGTQFDTRTDVIMIGSQCSHGPDRKIRPCAPQHLDSCAASSGLPCLLVSGFCTWTVANLALSQKEFLYLFEWNG